MKDWDVKIYRGILTGYNEAFIIDEETKENLIADSPNSAQIIRPILRGKHIKKYGVLNQKEWIIIIPCGWTDENRGKTAPNIYFEETYPSIYNHFKQKASISSKGKGLYKRDDQGDYWWELRPCVYLPEFEKEKILYIDIMTDNEKEGYPFPCFSYAFDGVFTLNTAYFMVGNTENLKYILGVLNSKLGKFIVKSKVTPLQKRQYRMFQQFVDNFIIPIPTNSLKEKVIHLVNKVIRNKTLNKSTLDDENQISMLVSTSCNLSEKEMSFIMSQE